MALAERGWRAAQVAGLAGLVLAGAIVGAGRAVLIEAARVEPFRVEVAAPHSALAGAGWRGRVLPAEIAERAALRVDGAPIAFLKRHGPESMSPGTLEVALDDTPGLRLVEVEVAHQGGRVEVVTDAVFAGSFVDRREEPRCGAAVRVAGVAIERIVVPPLRERLLAAARGVSLLGPETVLGRAEVRLGADALEFHVTLAGEHRIGVSGSLSLRVAGPQQLEFRLASLGPVEFAGSLRTKATAGAAAAGALVTGPFAPLGALAGYLLADRYVDHRARKEVDTRLREALDQASALPLVPESAELIVGEPRSRAALRLCEVAIEPGGIAAHLSLRPEVLSLAAGEATARVRARLAATPGPTIHGVRLPALRPVAPAADAEVDLTLEAIDALLDAWTVNGLLVDLAARAGWVERVDAELAAWTTLSLAGIEVGLPPALSPGTGDGWGVTIAGLRLDLRGVEGPDPGDILVAGRGTIRPHYDAGRGRVELTGSVDRVRISCAREGALWPCFGALLELGEVEARLDDLLAPGAAGLPGIDVRTLLRAGTTELRPGGVELVDLAITYPARGVLRASARVK